MVATARDQGKSTFIKELLLVNDQANPRIVNEAWTAAGHEGSISPTLVQKIRSELGLSGNIRPRRGRSASADGGRGQHLSGPRPRRDRGEVKRLGREPGLNGSQNGLPVGQGGESEGRLQVLTKLEGDIDEMIYAVKDVGGLPEFEETLRKARRILARSHEE